MTKRLKVGVIFGGKSGEHEVSIQSAKSIMASLNPSKYSIVPIGIGKDGSWHVGETAMLELEEQASKFLGTAPDVAENAVPASYKRSDDVMLAADSSTSLLTPPVLTNEIDVVIPVMHGTYGEDGSIQGMLELMDVAYVGGGVLASAVGLDKIFMKTMFLQAGLPQVRFTHYTRKALDQNPEAIIADIEAKLGYPCFVKPASLGSSVGISKAKNASQLRDALILAAKFDRKIIVEEGLDVREIEVAVLGNDEPKASVPGEVVPSNEFYDYQAKYLSGDSTLTIPANVTPEQSDEIRRLAVEAFLALDCSGLARVDFFIEKETGKVLLNEINTMPGFTAFSMYPKLWEATGLPYAKLVDELLALGLERFDEKQRTVRTFDL